MEIKVMVKPENISFEDIHNLLYKAHEDNRKIGFTIRTAEMSGDELEEYIGKEGRCFIALDGDKLVGTLSTRINNRSFWCAKGKTAELSMVGILPEYRGNKIFPLLYNLAIKDCTNNNSSLIEIRTADKNIQMQNLALKNGFKKIDFTTAGRDHYTVILLKWLEECPYPKFIINLRYLMKKTYVIFRYKHGRKKRFGI